MLDNQKVKISFQFLALVLPMLAFRLRFKFQCQKKFLTVRTCAKRVYHESFKTLPFQNEVSLNCIINTLRFDCYTCDVSRTTGR